MKYKKNVFNNLNSFSYMCLNFCHLDPQFSQPVKLFNISYILLHTIDCIGETYLFIRIHAIVVFDFRIHVVVVLHSYFLLADMHQPKPSKLSGSNYSFHLMPEILVVWQGYMLHLSICWRFFFSCRYLRDTATDVHIYILLREIKTSYFKQ